MSSDFASLVHADIRLYFALIGKLYALQKAAISFEQLLSSKVSNLGVANPELANLAEILHQRICGYAPFRTPVSSEGVSKLRIEFESGSLDQQEKILDKYQQHFVKQLSSSDADQYTSNDLTNVFRYWVARAMHRMFWQAKFEPKVQQLSQLATAFPVISELRNCNEVAKTKLQGIKPTLDGTHRQLLEKVLTQVIKLLEYNQTVFVGFNDIFENHCKTVLSRAESVRNCLDVSAHRFVCLAGALISGTMETSESSGIEQHSELWTKILDNIRDNKESSDNIACRFLVSIIQACDRVELVSPFAARFWDRLARIIDSQSVNLKCTIRISRPQTFGDSCEVHWSEPGSPFQTRVTGVQQIVEGKTIELVRAQVSAPKRVPSIYEKIKNLAQSCGPERRLLREECERVLSLLSSCNSDRLQSILTSVEVGDKLKQNLFELLRLAKQAQRLSPPHKLLETETLALADLYNEFSRYGITIKVPSIDAINSTLETQILSSCLPGVKSGIVLLDVDWGDGDRKQAVTLSAPKQSPLLQCFATNFDEILQLQRDDPDWEYWKTLEIIRLDCCRSEISSIAERDLRSASWQVFGSLLKRSRVIETNSSLKMRYTWLAGEFYEAFEKLGGRSSPRWRKEARAFDILRMDDLEKCHVRWQVSAHPAGTIVEVTDYGDGLLPISVVASAGQQLASAVLQLPNPDFVSAPDELAKLFRLYQQVPVRNFAEVNQEIESQFKALRVRLRGELEEWFNDWIHRTLSGGLGESSVAWLKHIVSKISVYPSIDFEGKRIFWEPSSHTVSPKIRFESNSAPIDSVLYPLDRDKTVFSTKLDSSSVVLSSGPTAKPLLEKCGTAWDDVRSLIPGEADQNLRQLIGKMLLQLRDTDRGIPLEKSFSEKPLGYVFAEVLEELRKTAYQAPVTQLESYDRVLGVLSRVWEFMKGSISPPNWKFSQAPNWDERWGEFSPSFGQEEQGTVRLQSFGVALGEKVITKCSASISAGPAPPGFDKLLQLEKKFQEEIKNAKSSEIGSFFLNLKKLPSYAVNKIVNDGHQQSLSSQVEDFFRNLHHILYDEIANIIPEKSALRKSLIENFDLLLSEYSLITFPSGEIQFMSDLSHEVEEWFDYLDCGVSLDDSSRQRGNSRRRGWIKDVERPGLMYVSHKRCLVLAKVSLRLVND